MSHSAEQMSKKAAARAEALHHMKHSAVDGKHDDMPLADRMYQGQGVNMPPEGMKGTQ